MTKNKKVIRIMKIEFFLEKVKFGEIFTESEIFLEIGG